MAKQILIFSLLLLVFVGCKEELDQEEKPDVEVNELITAINEYRVSKHLSEIPASSSLNIVAQTHIDDLQENYIVGSDCNLHSWSDSEHWDGCCYTSDNAEAECMWNKPSELTNYPGVGFEIAAYSSNEITRVAALGLWKNSDGHNNVILNLESWENTEWNAIGAAIQDNFAVVWFGQEEDPGN